MRTTVAIDDQVLADAKRYALKSGKTLGAVIEDALREALAARQAAVARPRVPLVTFGSGGLQPGVSLTDSAALLDVMEGR